jgi:hypothetical protein
MPLLGTDGLDAPVLGDRRTRGAGRLPMLAAATAAGEPTAVGNGRKGLSTAVGNGCKGRSGTAVLHAPLCCTPGDPEGVSAVRTKGLRTAEGVSAVRSAEGVSAVRGAEGMLAVRRADGMSVVRRKGLC